MLVGSKSKRRLGFQSLEKRQLLAAQISELLVDPLFGNNNQEQYIELRGEPNQTLEQGSYLVVVSERRPNAGEIHGIFDLSNQSFGTNGYLAILQHENPYEVHPGANALVSTAEGFGGLPGGIYTDSHSLSDRIDFIIGANAYMLIQSDTPPELDQNIDANEDGVIDEFFQQAWNVLDSISLHPFVGRGERAFGQIVFAEIGTGPGDIAVGEGVELIHTEGFGYAGRVGESTGHRETDWVASTPQNENLHTALPPAWALADNLFGEPSQYPFAGRDLDHLGEANFVGGVRGTVRLGSSGAPTEGATVLADINGNGIRDSLQYVIDPDDVVDLENPLDENGKEKEYPLINAFPNVTVTNFALGSFPAHAVTAEKEKDFPNTLENRIFAKGGIDWFTASGTLRFDFYRPVNAVSVVAIGSDNSLSKVYGRLDAYNAAGELLDTDVSSLLIDSGREVISVSSEQDNIAYVFAYADQEHADGEGGPFGRFDRMTYSQLEPAATTDENGYYEIQHLFPDTYQVSVLGTDLVSNRRIAEVEKFENYNFDFTLTPNQPPTADPANFQVPENTVPETAVGFLSAVDPEQQALHYRIAEGQTEGLPFRVNEATGEISVAPGAELDFESNSQTSFSVIVTDTQGASVSADVTVEILDLNEAPEAEFGLFRIQESAELGSSVGTIAASDPDTNANQTLVFEVIGGSGAADFSIHPETGVITLARAQDVSQDTEKTLQLRISDTGSPSLSTTIGAIVLVEDVNGAPDIEPSTFTISELAEGGNSVGIVTASDADPEQTLTFSIVGESDRFRIESETGALIVKEGVTFDFETQSEFAVLVAATDNGDPQQTATAEQIIRIEDVNESPILTIAEYSIRENAEFGSLVGAIEASDPDQEQTLRFEIIGESAFAIHPDTGLITVNDVDALNFEDATEKTVTVQVSDDGDPSLSVTETISITITDVNEAPVIVTESLQVTENASGEIGQVEAEDPDREQSHTFELVGGTARDLVTITPDGRIALREDALLDYEANQDHTLEILVTDDGIEPALSIKTISLVVLDQNEAPRFNGEVTPPDAMSGERFEYALNREMIDDPDGNEFSVEATIPGEGLPDWLSFDPIELVFRGIPSSFFAGTVDITLRAFQSDNPELASSITFQLIVGLTEKPLHNTEIPQDVNGDNAVTASDALRIINFIRSNDSQQEIDQSVRQSSFYDVTGDNFVTSLDALRVINEMTRLSLGNQDGASVASTAPLADDDDAQDQALQAFLAESTLF
ncbi:MAG: cadherin domain-containing protein [Rubripirellula sp.]